MEGGERRDLRKRFERIAASLSRFDLTRLEPEDVRRTDAHLGGPDLGRGDDVYFLGYYTRAGVLAALEAYGLLNALARRGHDDLHVTFDTADPSHQRLRIHSREATPERIVAEVIAHEGHLRPRPREGDTGYRVVVLDWITLRDPDRDFTPERPRLPGQRHPGLGLAAEVLELIRQMARRLDADGILTVPEHYHNAILYMPGYRFVDAARQGRVEALRRSLASHGLAVASWALEWGCVLDGDDQPVAWPDLVGEMVLPLTPPLQARLTGPLHRVTAATMRGTTRYRLDVESFSRCREEALCGGLTHLPEAPNGRPS